MKKSKLLVFILLFSFVINFLPKQALANEDKPPENKNKVVEEKKELVVKKEGTDKEISDNGKSVKRRDVEQTKLFDIMKSAVVEKDKSITVTTTIKPKQIYNGADVIILLDTSKKMTEESKKSAKESIKKIVKTLLEDDMHKNLNSVRLISFYRQVKDSVELKPSNVEQMVEKAFEEAKKNTNYGVSMQAAIHKAENIFDKEKNNGKRQHIVLMSQGEATFSYDIKDKEKARTTTVKGDTVVGESPFFPWPFYVEKTFKKANMIKDFKAFIKLLNRLGIHNFDNIKDNLGLADYLKLFGLDSAFDYIKLKEFESNNFDSSNFDYSKTVGEGYHNHSYQRINVVSKEFPFKKTIMAALRSKIEKENAGEVEKILNKATVKVIETALDTIFYQREYVFYNHNLSAQGEAKIAKNKKISFYSVNVTDKSDKKKAELQKYLRDMSENGKFLDTNDSKLADKFKDVLKEIFIEDKLHKDYEAEILEKDGNAIFSKGGGIIFSYPPKVNWTLNAEDIKNAFEKDIPLKLVYKLKPKKDVGTADITLAESTAKYKINDDRQKSENAGKLLLKLQDVIIESNVVDETEDTQSGSSGSYPNGKDLTTVEDTKPEGNKKENNNKEDNKQKPNDVNKNQKAKVHKEKSSKIPKTAIAGSSTLLLAVGLLGMYISKRRNGK
ncbi:VWA domain-containing protein [Parvimonas micra]|uniref:serum opacification factor n=1 Tax=Parvimonas micra TaxID=33033 RepID=UPI0022B749C8|nr:serum opacification factor [Parvimonas micra]WBB38481.1 VWA domain-containing protein [Parvimonas micra]